MKKIKDIPIGSRYLIRITRHTTRILKKGKNNKFNRIGDYPDMENAFRAILRDEIIDLDEKELKVAENAFSTITSLYAGMERYATNPIDTELTENELNILRDIELGSRNNRVTREKLSWRWLLTDRDVRQCISNLRKKGHWVCSLPDASGYWLAENEQDKKDFISYYTSPAADIFATIRALESHADGQIGGLGKE